MSEKKWPDARVTYELHEHLARRNIHFDSKTSRDEMIDLLERHDVSYEDVMADGRMESESKLPFPPKGRRDPSPNDDWRKKRPRVQVEKLPKAELEFLRHAKTPDLLPNLWKLPEADRENIIISSGLEFKSSYPERDVLQFWFYADHAIEQHGISEDGDVLITSFLNNPLTWEAINWGENEDDRNFTTARMNMAFNRMKALRAQYPDEKSDRDDGGPKGDGDTKGDGDPKGDGIEYDFKERRDWRAQFHGRGSPEANRMELKDPENGKDAIADILGRHPVRKTWLAVALPSLNEEYPKLSRGYYINAGAAHPQAFSRYVKEGANITLSTATHKSEMENCAYENFELNLVLCMPWGDKWHYQGYGIPHYVDDRDFVLWSKGLLVQCWKSAAMEVLHDHMIKAGQGIPITSDVKNRIKPKSWRK
ncbi:hypothetical protein FDENT_9636 [Fusarium denticulatum]|uniref:Uncharacterized protein n=1 Tax=Fusarium denticulatum TaxID=48507 RepID=A0A8H5WZP3_9HYPO|nr:hypothetical protein FDENT_9636 [Fusarium denticulatum]